MKKTYIIPETVVVALNVCDNVMQVGSPTPQTSTEDATDAGGPGGDLGDGYGREVINTPSAWEEW